jgi:hypothetical protein
VAGTSYFVLAPRAYAHWEQKSNNTHPIAERITIAQNAINQMTPKLNATTGEFNGASGSTEGARMLTALGIGYWQSGNVWSVLANQDHLAGTTTNKALVVNNLNLVFSRWAHYDKLGCTIYLTCYRVGELTDNIIQG